MQRQEESKRIPEKQLISIPKKTITDTIRKGKWNDKVIGLLKDFVNTPKIKALSEKDKISFGDFIGFASQKEICAKYQLGLSFLKDEYLQTKSCGADLFKLWKGTPVVFQSPDMNSYLMTFADTRALINWSMVDKTRNDFAKPHLNKRFKTQLSYMNGYSYLRDSKEEGNYYRWARTEQASLYHYLSPDQRRFYFLLHIGDVNGVMKALSKFGCSNYVNGIIAESGHYAGHPLTIAAEQGHIGLVNFLLSHKKLKVTTYQPKTELPLEAAARNGHEKIIEILLSFDKKEKSRLENPTIMFNAVRGGHIGVVKLLHESKVDINCQGSSGTTPISQAVSHWQIKAADYLLENKADVNQSVSRAKGMSLLHVASGANAELERCDDYKQPNGSSACPPLIEFLLEHKANINARDPDLMRYENYDRTPLHYAAKSGSTEAVRILLARGANTQLKDMGGRLPVDLVENDDVRRLFLQHEVNDFITKDGKQHNLAKSEAAVANTEAKETKESAVLSVSGSSSTLFPKPLPEGMSLLDMMQIFATHLLQPMAKQDREDFSTLAKMMDVALKLKPTLDESKLSVVAVRSAKN